MRYLKTLLVAMLALVGMVSYAQSWTADEIGEGYYLLYNVGAKQYFTKGNGWGTQASIATAERGKSVAFEVKLVGGKYFLRTGINGTNNGLEHLAGGTVYTDQSRGKQSTWEFKQVGDDNGPVYNIVSADNHGGGAGAYLEANSGNTIVGPGQDGSSDYAKWKVLNLTDQADLLEAMDAANPSSPVDATALILDADFSYTDIKFWTMQAGNQNLCGGTDANPCAESWRSSFTLSQVLQVPNGVYKLQAQAAMTDYAGTGADLPVVYANDVQAVFPQMKEGENSMSWMSDQFTKGMYEVNPLTVKVQNGSLTVGVKGTRNDTWCIWDNFRLEYQGMAPLLKDLLDKANELMPTLNETNAAELKKAIDAAQAVYDNASSTNSEIEAAMEALQDAYNTADAENIAKKKAIEVLNNVPYVLFPKDFKWALEDGEKYDKLTGEQKMDLDRDFKVYKNNNGKYQLASRVAVLALVKLLEYADADENTKKAIKARMDELGIEGYDEMLADAITTYTRLVVETHGVGAALGEQGDPNYSRMYTALEEAGEDPDVFIDALVYGATRTYLEDTDPYWGGGTISGNSWTSADGLVTITNVNNPIQSSNYYDYYWDIQKGEDWKIQINSDGENINLSRMYLDSGGAKVTVKSGSNTTELDLDGWTYYRAPLSGKEATIHIDDVYYSPDDRYAGLYMYVYVEESYDPWVEAGVERTTSDVYELLHQYLGGYSYGFDANFTAHIKDPNLTEGGDAWESTWGILNNEPLTDSEGNTEYPYFDANTWNESGTMEVDAHQTIQLPPGRYMLTAAGRASQNSLKETKSSHAGLDIVSTIWEGPFTEPGAQDPANYFQLYATTFEGKTVAKSFFELEGNKGGIFDNGWNDASVFFTMPSVGDVTIGVRAATNVKERWASATRFRLTRLGDATVYLNEDETLTDELNWDVVGYNLGAYTPTDFLLKKEMQAGKWYSIAVPCDIPYDQIIREFGEGTLLAQPIGVLDLDEEGKQKLLGFLEWDPNDTYAMYGMGTDHVYGDPIDGILANTPYLIKPATVKASNRYLFKDVFAVEKKSVEKSEWSWGAVSVSDVDNEWSFWEGDYGPVKFYPNYTYKPGYADGYTVEVCDTVKAYTGLFEVEGDAEIGTIGLFVLDEDFYINWADDAFDIPVQQILDLVALGQQKAEMYPGIPAAMTKKLTTVPELDGYITTYVSAINALKAAIVEAQKAYEPSKKFNALMKKAEDLLASDHTELVAGADAAFKKKIEQLQKRFDMLLKADGIEPLIEQLEAAIAEYKEQIFVAGVLEAGNYYIKNVATGKFLNGGNSWGTRVSVSDNRDYFTLAVLENGAYTLESRYSNGGTSYYLGPNYYVDNGTPMELTITAVGENVWTISCTGDDTGQGTNLRFGYIGWDGTENTAMMGLTDGKAEGALWTFISEEDMLATLNDASLENPVNATILIKDPNFSRNHRDISAWDFQYTGNPAGSNCRLAANSDNAGNYNCCSEAWQASFTLTQNLEKIPNGVYMLTAQGAVTDYAQTGADFPVFFAGDETSVFAEMDEVDRGTSMYQLTQRFDKGDYTCEPMIVEVDDGTLSIGARGVRDDIWTIWDNFQLTYFGNADIDAVRAAYPKNTGATTGINEVNTGVNTGAIYNLNGVRVNNMTKKGVYIVNGKKIVVK